MELRHLRYFLVVAEEEHMTRASERLRIAQPALTRQIKELELEIGCDLFTRLPRGIKLNKAGKTFLIKVREILRQVKSAVKSTQQASLGQTGILKLAFVDPVAWEGEFPNALRRFRTKYSEVLLSIEPMWSRIQLEATVKGMIDGGFCYGFEELPNRCQSHQIREDQVVLAVPRHFGWRTRRLRCKDLLNEPFIGLNREAAPQYFDMLYQEQLKKDFHPNVVQTASDENVLLCLVSTGVGVALVNDANQSRKPNNVDFISISDFKLKLPLQFVWKEDNSNPTLVNFRRILGLKE